MKLNEEEVWQRVEAGELTSEAAQELLQENADMRLAIERDDQDGLLEKNRRRVYLLDKQRRYSLDALELAELDSLERLFISRLGVHDDKLLSQIARMEEKARKLKLASPRYRYILISTARCYAVYRGENMPDSYIADDAEGRKLVHVFQNGYRWVRTEDGWAVWEKEVR